MTDPWARPPAPGDPDDSGQPPPPGYGPPGESTPGPALPPDAAPPPDAGAFPPPPPPPPGYGAPGAVPPPEAGGFPPPPPPPGYGPPSYPIDQDPAALPPPPHAGPPAAPPGYGPPPYPGYGPPGYGPPPRPYDPLVAYDFSSWFDRLKGVVARSWKGIVQLTLLGYVLPVMLLTVVVVAVGWGGIFAMVTALNQRSDTTEPGAGSDVALPILGLLFLLIVVVAVVAGYLNAVTSLSIVKVATNDAVETPVGPADAYRSSLRLGWPTLGWAMLAGLAVGIGWVLCCLPGIYLMVALSLIVPIMAFERQGGFAGSLKLTHTNFWPTAGRVLLLFLVVMAATYAANIVLSIATLPFTPSDQSGEVSGTMVVLFVLANIVKFVVVQMVSIAGQMLLLSGYLVTYAELRGRLQPELSARHLAAEVNA